MIIWYLAHKPLAIPTRATTYGVSCAIPQTLYKQSCCCVRVSVCFFSCFLVSLRGAKRSEIFFQKVPRPHIEGPGASFYACKIIAPQGGDTRIMMVLISSRRCMGRTTPATAAIVSRRVATLLKYSTCMHHTYSSAAAVACCFTHNACHAQFLRYNYRVR